MANILPGFQWDGRVARYRDTARGQFVSRTRITSLLEQQVQQSESRLAGIVTAMSEGELAPGVGQMLLRDELRRMSLTSAALGKGGIERLDFRDFGRVGRQLRDSYARLTDLAREMQAGNITLPQALNRVHGYAGEARRQFFIAEREALMSSGSRFEERRRLGAAEHCKDCVKWAGMGWQPAGSLPLPGNQSICGVRCRCTLERREMEAQPLAMPLRAERMLA